MLTVGIDLATAALRAVALDGAGKVLSEFQTALPEPYSPQPGWSEQDASSWTSSLARTLGRLTADLGPAAAEIQAVSVAATSGTILALGPDGQPIRPALTYADQRASSEAAVAREAAGERWESLGLTMQPSFGLPKMAWLAANTPGIHRLAHASDLLVWYLTGEAPPTDWSHALKSGYDPVRKQWTIEAIDALDVDYRLLPKVLPPAETAGTVCRTAAEETGLPGGCLVKLGMTDSCASQLAAGAGSPGSFVSVLGSTLVLKGATDQLVNDPEGAVYSHRHPQGWWLPGGASNAGGRYLTRLFEGQDLATLDDRAAQHGPASALLYPLTGIGERFPVANPRLAAFTVGDIDDPVEHYRAALEGVAFVEKLGYERLGELGMAVKAPIFATGRGSASLVWSRIRATALGMPLMVVEGASSARGAAILAASGTLHPDLESAARAMAARGELVRPVEQERDRLDLSYMKFRRMCFAWKP